MRTIKFRGKQRSWIYGGVSIFNGEASILDYNCIANSSYEVDIKTIGQFTGLCDINGNEIYEGDIIEFGGVGVVKYAEDRFFVDYGNMHTRVSKHQKIIGNIHDNPELLDA